MIAEVYPFLRLPRRFSFFDYQIPTDLAVQVGDVVSVLFRGRSIQVLIKAVKATSDAPKLATIEHVTYKSWCNKQDIERLETISECIAQSVPSLLHALPRPVASSTHKAQSLITATTSRSVQKTDAELVTELLTSIDQLPKAGSLAIAADKELSAILCHVLRKKTSEQMLILLARERDADLLVQSIALGNHVAVLHGKTPERERSNIGAAWQSGNLRTLVATRMGALISANRLSHIVVLDSGSEDHMSSRRNPRFDAREAAKLLAIQHEAKIVFIDNLPRLEEISHSLDPSPTLRVGSPCLPVGMAEPRTQNLIVNLRNKLEYTKDPLLTETLIAEVKTALQSRKKVLLFLNRKGVAKRLQCGSCGHLPLCGTCASVPMVRLDDLVCERCGTEMWIPKVCPQCGQAKLALRGIGGASIEAALSKIFPSTKITRVEKGSPKNLEADIIIATEYFFSSVLSLFPEKQFALVADLIGDVGLHGGDFRAGEVTARKLHRLMDFAKRQGAACIIQTWLPEVIEPMLDLQQFVQTELDLRKKYSLPPFTSRVILENAEIDDLPESLKSSFTPHGDHLESRTRNLEPEAFSLLSDKIKLTFDGPYVSHDRTPQSK